MLVYVEIWHRQKGEAAYRRHGIEELEALLDAGTPMTLKMGDDDCHVTVDKATRTTVSIAAVGTLWVTDA